MAARKANLEALVDHFESQRALGEAVGWAPSYISQMLTGRRNMGENSARHVEERLGFSRGAMDQTLSPEALPSTKSNANPWTRVPILTRQEVLSEELIQYACAAGAGPTRGFTEVGPGFRAQHGPPRFALNVGDDRKDRSTGIILLVETEHLRAGDAVLVRTGEPPNGEASLTRWSPNEKQTVIGKAVEFRTSDERQLMGLCNQQANGS